MRREWEHLLSGEQKRVRGDHVALHFLLLRKETKEGGASLFFLVIDDRMHENGTKMCQRMFRLDIRINFHYIKPYTSCWHFDSNLNNMLSVLVSPKVIRQLDLMIFEYPFYLFYCIPLYCIPFSFHSFLIPFHSHSIPFYCIPFLFHSILLHSILMHSILIPFYYTLSIHSGNCGSCCQCYQTKSYTLQILLFSFSFT